MSSPLLQVRLKAALDLLSQMSELIGCYCFSKKEENSYPAISSELEKVVQRFRENPETKVSDLSSEFENIIRRFRINNNSMSDVELQKISEEFSNKWGIGGIPDFSYPLRWYQVLSLSLELLAVMETLLHNFADSKKLLWRINQVSQNFLTYIYFMNTDEIQEFVEKSVISLKAISLQQA
jgi:hypothetical protein